MTMVTTKRLTQLTATLLTTGALLMPGLVSANAPAKINAPVTLAMSTETQPATEFRKLRKMLQPLNLTAEQQTQVDNAIKNVQPETDNMHQQMKANRLKLHAQQFAEQYNAKDAEALANAQGQLVQRMLLARTQLHRTIYAALTPAQREQLRTQQAAKLETKIVKGAEKAKK